jgi:hypothetical protein
MNPPYVNVLQQLLYMYNVHGNCQYLEVAAVQICRSLAAAVYYYHEGCWYLEAAAVHTVKSAGIWKLLYIP